MYHPEVIAALRERAQAKIRKDIDDDSFELVEHSIEECQAAARWFDDLYDAKTNGYKRDLSHKEKAWVLNERACCRTSFLYAATRYYWVISKEGDLVLFAPFKAQEIFLDLCAEHQLKGVALAFIVLKARQLGMTTVTELMIAHRVQFGPYTVGLVASSDPDSTLEMFNKVTTAWQHVPQYLMPRTTLLRTGERIEFGGQNSTISLQWLNQRGDLGRGRTPLVAHVSECAAEGVDRPAQKIEAGLMRAMHDSPKMFLELESTANGMGDWWHETWDASKKGWDRGTGRLRPIFLPWFIGTDKYPSATWLRAHPVPADWKPAELTARHAVRATIYAANNPLLKSVLGDDWKMPVEQQWFWEAGYLEAREADTLNKWYQEMPADDTEAFQISGSTVFSNEMISNYYHYCADPKLVFGLRGKADEVPERFTPGREEINPSGKPIPLRCRDGSIFELVPLMWDAGGTRYELGKLFIWELPKANETYAIAVDPSKGVGKDRSVILVIRKGSTTRLPAIIAEWANDLASGVDLIPFVYALHEFYTVKVNGIPQQPKQVIELDSDGSALQRAMLELHCTNVHVWTPMNRAQRTTALNPIIGVQPMHQFRDPAVNSLVSALRGYQIEIHSRWFVQEMGSLTGGDLGRKIEATKGTHDDRFLAAANGYFSLHYGERIPEQRQKSLGIRTIMPNLTDEQRYGSFKGYGNDIDYGPNQPARLRDFQMWKDELTEAAKMEELTRQER